MEQFILVINFNEQSLFATFCVENVDFSSIKKYKLDIENENDKQSTSNDSTISIRLKPEVELNDERIEAQIQRTVSTHNCCICSAIKNIIIIPEEAMQSFINMRLHLLALRHRTDF